MADPITWGLINLVRKGIKSVQTAIDGVGDTVNNLPSSLETDFTEVKNDIASVKNDTEEILLRLNNIDEIYSLVVKNNQYLDDIYYGNSVVDWINDLRENGTNSDTYKDSERMNYLCAFKNAVVDTSVNTYLTTWAVNNGFNLGTYFGTMIGSVEGLTWSNCETIQQLYSNDSAFNAIANSSVAFNALFGNSTLKNNLYTYWKEVEDTLGTASVSKNKLQSSTSGNGNMGGGDRDTNDISYYAGKKMYFSYLRISVGPSWGDGSVKITITQPDNSLWSKTIQTGDYYTTTDVSNVKIPINKFGTRMTLTAVNGGCTGWQEPRVIFFS